MKIKITSNPNNCTMLDRVNAKINHLLSDYYNDLYEKISISIICDQNWNKGIEEFVYQNKIEVIK